MPYLKEPIKRKLTYISQLASPEGIDLSMGRWSFRLPEIELSIGFNVVFRFLLDMYLTLNFHIPSELFDYHQIDFLTSVALPKKAVYSYPVAVYGNATYDSYYYADMAHQDPFSKYGESVYDPEQVTGTSLERFVWNMRYKTTYRDDIFWKSTSKALTDQLNINKDLIKEKGVNPDYADGLVDIIALVEGKIKDCAYFDFAIFDLSRFKETPISAPMPRGTFKARLPDGVGGDWKTEGEFETEFPYECHFDFARWDYARFYDTGVTVKPPLPEYLDQVIREFHKRSGYVEIEEQGVKYNVLHQRVFMLPRVEKYHWEGGKHQLKLQRIINEVKRLLDRRGIAGNIRMGYISFAQQLAYLYYKPHKYWKHWRGMLTPEDLINKFKRLGLDETILGEIRRVVKP